MTDSRLATRRPPQQGIRAFGDLPPATTTMSLDRALELAGVDETELALLGSTTFKEAQSLEELVSLIATTRRRGLDGMSRHVYYERFGGQNSEPSLHVAIDGLRAIAAATGRYGGRSEPRYSDVWDMPLDERGVTKPVPAKCVMTVYAIVQNRSCAFEGVAWMEESYPGPSARGRMWRQRPRSMLSIAAERQALRAAFPTETSGLRDLDEGDTETIIESAPSPPRRTVAESAALYDRIQDLETGEALPPPLEPETIGARSPLASRLAELIEDAARLEVPFDDCRVLFPASRDEVIRKGEQLRDRIEAKKAQLAHPAEPEPALL